MRLRFSVAMIEVISTLGSKKRQPASAFAIGMESCAPVAKVLTAMVATTLSTLTTLPQLWESI